MNSVMEMKNAKEINLKAIFKVIKKRLWLIIVTSFLAAVAGGAYSTYYKVPLYQSSAHVIIGADENFMKTLKVLAKEPMVMEDVIKELDIQKSPGGLAGQISISTIGGSQIVKITVTDTNPELAAKIANATVEAFKNNAEEIFNFNKFRMLTEAKENTFPFNINTKRTATMAFMLGAILGIGLVFFLDSLDERVKSEYEIEKILGLTLLGRVSKINRRNIKQRRGAKVELEVGGEPVGFK